jgi:hypothetical protein
MGYGSQQLWEGGEGYNRKGPWMGAIIGDLKGCDWIDD